MDLEKFGEIVNASVVNNTPVTGEQVAETLSDHELVQALLVRGLTAGTIATAVAEMAEIVPAAPTTETTPYEVDINPEERERASGLQTAFAEKFSTDERELTPEDFGVVVVGEGEARQVFVMLTTGNGLQHGSYNKIMGKRRANAAKYTVEVDGQKIDTRKVMTRDLYYAFITQAKAPLPDSVALLIENSGYWTVATWLTGEEPYGSYAQYGAVHDGDPLHSWESRGCGWRHVGFRPAAVV